jgi:hypothetical protein
MRTVQFLFLQAERAFALREFFKHDLAVKRHHVRRKFFQLLRQQDAPFGELLPLDLLRAARGALHQIRQTHSELDHPFIVLGFEQLRHDFGVV